MKDTQSIVKDEENTEDRVWDQFTVALKFGYVRRGGTGFLNLNGPIGGSA